MSAPSSSSDGSSPSSRRCLQIRLSNGTRFEVRSDENATVRQVQESIAAVKAEFPVAQQRLIYKGQILTDASRTLEDYGVTGLSVTLFLVKVSGGKSGAAAGSGGTAAATAGTAAATTASTATTTSTSTTQNSAPTATASSHPWNASSSNNAGNSMLDQLFQNPQWLQQTLSHNPQVQSLMEQNPELRHVLEDPASMRQAMDMMRNPEYMQQMMRQQDLAMSQLENMPGGMSALRNLYTNLQEPMMEAAAGGNNATTSSNNAASSSAEGATGAAMPNPWSTAPSTASRPTTTTTNPWGTTTTPAIPNMNANTNNPWASGAPPTSPFAAANPLGMPNPEDMIRFLEQNPQMGQMMTSMWDANPQGMQSMMEQSNPLFGQLRQSNPQMADFLMQQMRNMLQDPQQLRNMLQLQQQMNLPSMNNNNNNNMPPNLDFSNLLQQFQGIGGLGGGGNLPQQQSPAERFQRQLQSLYDMGFDDEQANLAALERFHGNLNRAVDFLIESGPTEFPTTTTATSSEPSNASPPETNNNSTDEEPKNATDKKND